jgi:hypothetical protein
MSEGLGADIGWVGIFLNIFNDYALGIIMECGIQTNSIFRLS